MSTHDPQHFAPLDSTAAPATPPASSSPRAAKQPAANAESPVSLGGRTRPEPDSDSASLAHALEAPLLAECQGRLSEISWFRSASSSSGSATGTARWRGEEGEAEVIVKLPLGPSEYRWTTELGRSDARSPTPRVFAAGLELGGYDLAWVVEERVRGEPVPARMREGDALHVLQAAADFHDAALRVRPAIERPRALDWQSSLALAREVCHAGAIADAQRWNEGVKKVTKALPRLLSRWNERPINAWCHGDLHPGNVIRLSQPRDDSHAGVLIDLALVHPGHWLEDAVYLERQYWAAPQLLHGVKPVSTLARLRRERGLSVDSDYPIFADIRRVLMASLVPAFLDREGHPKYVAASLDVLEKTLPHVA